MNEARVLFIDIETAPMKALVWGMWDQNLSPAQVKSRVHILSFAAKWQGSKKMIYECQEHEKNLENDVRLCKLIWDLLDEADIVVAQNGRRFDMRIIRARMIINHMKPFSPVKVVDTLIEARRSFDFQGNSLENLSKILGCPVRKKLHKKFPGFLLWDGCLNNDKAAWREMKLYNIDDVLALEGVYDRLLPWMTNHPDLNIYNDIGEYRCPHCLSPVMKRGYYYSNSNRYQQYCCKSPSCGKYSHDRKALK